MQLIVRQGTTRRDVVVAVDNPAASLRTLMDELQLEGPGLDVDGRWVEAATPLGDAELVDGAELEPAGPHGPRWHDEQPATWLHVVAGPGSGTRVGLRPNERILVGRDQGCDLVLASPTVSARHAMVAMTGDRSVLIEDTESRNGTWVDGASIHEPVAVEADTTFRCGAVVLGISTPATTPPPNTVAPHGMAGSRPFNRRPRPAPSEPVAPVTVPVRIQHLTQSRAFRAAALLSPIMMGLFMMSRNNWDLRYAGFMIISPIAMLAMWISDRRRTRREGREADATFTQQLATFRARLHATWRADRRAMERRAPPIAEVLERATAPRASLWERRLGHPDALRLRLGAADDAWRAPLRTPDGAVLPMPDLGTPDGPVSRSRTDPDGPDGPDALDDEVLATLASHATVPNGPVVVDLSPVGGGGTAMFAGLDDGATTSAPPVPGGVIGIVGDGPAPRALARALLVQATTFHGPADLQVGVFTTEAHADEWDWAKWLPHTKSLDGQVRRISDRSHVSANLTQAWLDGLQEAIGDRPGMAGQRRPVGTVPMLLVDDLSLLTGRGAPARQLLAGAGGPASGIVVAPTVDQLPASCQAVVVFEQDGRTATVAWPATGRTVTGVIPVVLAAETAREAARTMARWDDPELSAAGGNVPDLVRLLPLLDLEDVTPDDVATRWAGAGTDPGARATLGADAVGPVTLDLPVDGPHGLVGGTTGSGKSELLRSMVASMAAQADPDHLVFVLVDYKGGSAFDLCAQLPHTVGMVTDLDEHLGARALVSLEAELHHREVTLRDVGAQDLPTYLDLGSPRGPMPRLVVVVDEFATMATDLPDFLGALVGIAQRGRSLGVHMILATQRPRGAVDANVRANTNLRIALRVQDPGDSTDIIDVPDAAELPRDKPGRAWIRRGHGDLVLVQSALSTAGAPSDVSPLRVVPFRFTPTAPLPRQQLTGRSDLERLVEACTAAFEESGRPAPRKPWLPMPEPEIPLVDMLAAADPPEGIVIGLEDVPEAQALLPWAWNPAEGNLGIIGMVGHGTTTTLLALAESIARGHDPDRLHVQAIDFGGGGLRGLAALPHVGAVVDGADNVRQARLVRLLMDEVAARRRLDPAQRAALPQVVVLVDKVGGFLAEHEGIEGRELTDAFTRVFKEGPAVGLGLAVTAESARDIPLRLRSQLAATLQFRVADEAPHGRSRVPTLRPGQAWLATEEHVVQIGLPGDLQELADTIPPPSLHVPDPIASIPDELPFDGIPLGASTTGGPLQIPVGLDAAALAPVMLELHPGDHLAIAGPPRSGKSTLLQVISSQLRLIAPDAIQLAVCDPDRSPLSGWESLDGSGTSEQLQRYMRAGRDRDDRWFVLVDDVGLFDSDTLLAELATVRPLLHLVFAGRQAAVRGGYGGWVRGAKAARTGVLLQPDLPADGDLLSTKLPRRTTTPFVPGRGFVVVGGVATLAQTPLPPGDPPPGGLGRPRS